MDSYEATKTVFSRIQSLDPENASKIMGFVLIQDHGEKEMIRLAFGPETLLHNLIINSKTQLGLLLSKTTTTTTTTTPPTSSSPSPFNPISRPNPLSLSPIASPSSNLWSLSNPMSPSSASSPSYANIVSKNSNTGFVSGSLLSSSSLSSAYDSSSSELPETYQFQSSLSFLNDPKTDDLFDGRFEMATSQSAYSNSSLQKQSYSVPSMCFGAEDLNSGIGWKPCLYYARGFCKNGSSCRFLHSGSIGTDGASIDVGSPSNVNVLEQCQELLRSNAAAQQQKLAAVSQFMAGGASFPYNKCMNFLMQQQNDTPWSAASALMMEDELHKFERYQHERYDISSLTLGGNVNHSSRQIYLTFPADSTFREEDVSNYFSIYGPVQDVRIPYQQKRMFGFVTFVYSETVKIILAKGNPHFVCDSRVLVKPYKEKGKVPDKKQQHQQLDGGDFHLCSSLSGIDSREPYDLNLGSRMFYNSQEMLLRRKLEEQANLQQAIELQERRLMNLQLLGIKSNNHHHQQHHQYYHGVSEGSPFPSPTLPHATKNQSLIVSPRGDEEVSEENEGFLAEQLQREVNNQTFNPSAHGNEDNSCHEFDIHECCMEHILPDSFFASPEKSDGDQINVFSTTASAEVNSESTRVTTISSANSNNNDLLAATSTPNSNSPKSVLSKCPGFLVGMEPLECN